MSNMSKAAVCYRYKYIVLTTCFLSLHNAHNRTTAAVYYHYGIRTTVLIYSEGYRLRIPNKDLPVYTVQKEHGGRKKQNLHRNHLLPVGFITETHEHDEENRPVLTIRKRKPTKVPPTMITDRPVSIQDYRQNDSSDEESVELVVIRSDADDDSNPSVTDSTSQQGEQNEVLATEASGSDRDALSQAEPTYLKIYKQKLQRHFRYCENSTEHQGGVWASVYLFTIK
ncbi:unnamed protein product [Mytilus edulis]|uniref:Uncharacterized protein n=1 Tax=Mytilus edulis TaxID=6550 RepID=A0A8S3S2Z2_MYTED|nr:unnamed protein product [Mytilus edulis]